MSTPYGDWTAVADITGCGKIYGAQGPAPSIQEMSEAFTCHINDMLRDTPHADLMDCPIPSIVASLVARSLIGRSAE